MRRARRGAAAALALAMTAAACTPAQAGGLGSVLKVLGKFHEVNQLLWIMGDRGAEKRLGYLLARFFLATNRISKDRQLNAYVNGIFDRLKAAAPRSGFRYRIHVIDSGQLNAFALPGGTIFIYRGMIDFAGSDDEVAAVLGHEIAHVVRRHSLKRFRRDFAALTLINKVLGDQDNAELVAKLAHLFTSMSYSRRNEDESDKIGMQISLDAGYDPSGAPSMWERMHARFGSRRGAAGFLSTHPSHSARIANTRKWLREKGLEYSRTRAKGYDSRTNQVLNPLINPSFEEGEGALPRGWTVLEGDAGAITYPSSPARSGKRAVTAAPGYGRSLMLGASPVPATMFHTPRSVSAHFRRLAGRPRVYLGVAYLDRSGGVLQAAWPGGEKVEVGREWTRLTSPPLDPATFPKGTHTVQVRMYLGRITGGTVQVDDVALVPKAQLDAPRTQAARQPPGGDFEFDADGDEQPDGGWTLDRATWDTQVAGRGFASIRLDQPGARLVTPRMPVVVGKRYRIRGLFRGEAPGATGEFLWRAFQRDGREIPGAPAAVGFQASPDWDLATDSLTLAPPPGTPPPAWVQVEVRVREGARLWVDDLTFRQVNEDGSEVTPPPAVAPGPQPAPPPPASGPRRAERPDPPPRRAPGRVQGEAPPGGSPAPAPAPEDGRRAPARTQAPARQPPSRTQAPPPAPSRQPPSRTQAPAPAPSRQPPARTQAPAPVAPPDDRPFRRPPAR